MCSILEPCFPPAQQGVVKLRHELQSQKSVVQQNLHLCRPELALFALLRYRKQAASSTADEGSKTRLALKATNVYDQPAFQPFGTGVASAGTAPGHTLLAQPLEAIQTLTMAVGLNLLNYRRNIKA